MVTKKSGEKEEAKDINSIKYLRAMHFMKRGGGYLDHHCQILHINSVRRIGIFAKEATLLRYRISLVIRQSYFPSKTIPKI